MSNSRDNNISGVVIKPLITHADDRGYFREVLRNDDQLLKRFGQTSMTLTYPGVVKAFHYHERQDDLWYVAKGMAQIVLYDRRPESKTQKQTQVVYAGEQNPVLVVIPKGVAHGYRVLGNEPVILFYHTTEPYRSDEPDEKRLAWDDPEIGFNWATQNR